MLRSVLLPLKAVVMNLLSISASFGALVWIFEDGHLAWLLRFEPGPLDAAVPVLLFCVVFGLSMDYEVLMLSRMREEYLRTGDNTWAVAEGLERTGRLVTSAAAIMVTVFAAFALARVILVKSLGVALAVAVAARRHAGARAHRARHHAPLRRPQLVGAGVARRRAPPGPGATHVVLRAGFRIHPSRFPFAREGVQCGP